MPIWSRPAANWPVNTLAADRILEQPLLLFMEPERSMTIIATTSRRDAFPIALIVMCVVAKPSHEPGRNVGARRDVHVTQTRDL